MNQELYNKFSKKYPFLTVCRYLDVEYVGIVENKDHMVTRFCDFSILPNQEVKNHFLKLGETWWWESNRTIPINIFLREEWGVFRPFTHIFNNKYLEIVIGPCVCLNDIANTKQKRKYIALVKKHQP